MSEEKQEQVPLNDEQLWKISTFVLESWKNQNSLVKAQIDSYNYFLQYTLPQIVIGEYGNFDCATDTGIRHTVSIRNLHYEMPQIIEASGQAYPLSPHMCLMRKLDYVAKVLVDIHHSVTDTKTNRTHEKVFREHHLFDMPVMVRSALCRTMEYEEFARQQSQYEFGGQFILSGAEKILIAQKKLRINHLFVSKKKKAAKQSWEAEIRCWTEEKMRSTSTSYFVLHEKKSETGLPLYEMKVKMPFLVKYEIPLLLVFRMLGIDHPEDYIPQDARIDILRRSILTDHSNQGYDTMPLDDIYELVAKRGIKDLSKLKTPEKRKTYVTHIIENEFLSNDTTNKPFLLGLCVWEALMTIKGVFKPGDRDSYAKKRVHCAGVLLALQLRILLRKYLKGVQLSLQKTIEGGRYVDVTDLMSVKKMSGLKTAISTGHWGVSKGSGKGGQDGTAQQYTRSNFQASLSHARRLNTPLNRESKLTKPRQLRPPHYGLVCASETPEGPSCGLIESQAILAHVRIGGGAYLVEWQLRRIAGKRLLPLRSAMEMWKLGTGILVLLNGTIMGLLQNDQDMHDITQALRASRRNQDLPFDTGIAWDHKKRHVLLTTDVGAMLRPFFVVEKLPLLRNLVDRFQYDPHFFHVLLSLGVIEYLDKEEEELNATVAYDIKNIIPEKTTHLDINPCVLFGFTVGIIPFSEHNQGPRNIYGSIQAKQPAGIPFTNHFHRFETSMHVLNYVQRPIVSTLIGNQFCNDELPSGINVILAIKSEGDNQEDSNILNQAFIDRGGLVSTEFHTYAADQILSNNDKEVFCKPQTSPSDGSAAGTVLRVQKGNYDLLTPEGFAPPGSILPENQGTAIIGKVMMPLPRANNQNDEGFFHRDRSLVIHPNEKQYVDRVLKTLGSEGNIIMRVRTRSLRRPEIGDKFAATCGQKSTTGMIRPHVDMPFSERTGIVPDVIMNPHCIPSRMTIGLLLETMLGKVSCLEGRIGDGTPFKELTAEKIGDVLVQHGFQRHGHERLIDGTTGEVLEGCRIFMGVCFFQRLRHLAKNKIHARHTGPMQVINRQAIEGRSRGGGLKFGEMESDSTKTHGCEAFAIDRLRKSADDFTVYICNKCGNFVPSPIPEAKQQILGGLFPSEAFCTVCESSAFVYRSDTAYSTKLLVQELQGLGFGMRLRHA